VTNATGSLTRSIPQGRAEGLLPAVPVGEGGTVAVELGGSAVVVGGGGWGAEVGVGCTGVELTDGWL
jgi:hypothetical protein